MLWLFFVFTLLTSFGFESNQVIAEFDGKPIKYSDIKNYANKLSDEYKKLLNSKEGVKKLLDYYIKRLAILEEAKKAVSNRGVFNAHKGIDKEAAYIIAYLTQEVDQKIEISEKEVEEYGFKAPKNSQDHYIDIYIANRNAYNLQTNSYVTISSQYAGYATAYSDATPYFVINPSVDLNILKVTIAHEFFHTIQYSYGLDIVSDEIWYKNIWFLEASAVLMEDEVYNNVNDYLNYLFFYIPYLIYGIFKQILLQFLKSKK